MLLPFVLRVLSVVSVIHLCVADCRPQDPHSSICKMGTISPPLPATICNAGLRFWWAQGDESRNVKENNHLQGS